MWNKLERYHDNFYFVFRLFVGLLFAQHGGQKLFGWFNGLAGTGEPVALLSLMGLAGVIEFFGGLAIATGFFTRLAALLGAVEMPIAYFMIHIPNGLVPLLNGGEPALLFFASFLILFMHGAKKWSLEKALLKKEMF